MSVNVKAGYLVVREESRSLVAPPNTPTLTAFEQQRYQLDAQTLHQHLNRLLALQEDRSKRA